MSDAAEIIAYLRARYDEKRASAHAAGGSELQGQWVYADGVVRDKDGLHAATGSETWLGQIRMRHIINSDPASVLADIESKRRILDFIDLAHALAAADQGLYSGARPTAKVLAVVAEALAEPFRDRPDFPEALRSRSDT